MQIELNAEELDLLIDWFDIMAELTGTKQEVSGQQYCGAQHVRHSDQSIEPRQDCAGRL